MSDELQRIRDRIDRLDADILERLSERARCAQRVGEIKQGNLYRPDREAQVLRRLADENPGPLPDHAVQRIFREIMSACLALEQPLRVAYLGPAGTFTESAARKHFGAAPAFSALAAIDDVFRAVEAGNADYGIVPVENSTEGVIGRTLDLLLASPLKICGEVRLRIHQNLMSRAPELGAVTKVYSHAQSLAQCHEWLDRNLRTVPRVAVASNAEAARLASDEDGAAAIGAEAAAGLYDLRILAANIEDEPRNTTRFVVIAQHDSGVSGQDRTSLVCSAPNRPGAVHGLLEPFARHGVSMSKLQSRPARGGMWEYVFYVDLEGHQADPPVAAALAELTERASFVKILGSYPVAAI
ncbi:prephenate dehydratase [Pseudazoarcus pumilus]|uniref:Bifunctional chorismate mutase/prephenate dehydratase n=1 Tax=Pseudazoarcus pumilus TaxID=2067960 RepID=A0A2I6S5Q1_9RHOO|nr:prephenate dehydratase [Pseudazoarcus pumilus]AUN94587.1 prephenate dehydratase [Pseudazoarcus pumilus]